jgi:hypothetical protein
MRVSPRYSRATRAARRGERAPLVVALFATGCAPMVSIGLLSRRPTLKPQVRRSFRVPRAAGP